MEELFEEELFEQTKEVVEGAYEVATKYGDEKDKQLAENMFKVLSEHNKWLGLQTKVTALKALFTALEVDIQAFIDDEN